MHPTGAVIAYVRRAESGEKSLAIRDEGPEVGDVRPIRPRIEPVLKSVAIARAGCAAMHTARGFGAAAGRGEEFWGLGFRFFMLCSVNPGFLRCLGRGGYTAYEASCMC